MNKFAHGINVHWTQSKQNFLEKGHISLHPKISYCKKGIHCIDAVIAAEKMFPVQHWQVKWRQHHRNKTIYINWHNNYKNFKNLLVSCWTLTAIRIIRFIIASPPIDDARWHEMIHHTNAFCACIGTAITTWLTWLFAKFICSLILFCFRSFSSMGSW